MKRTPKVFLFSPPFSVLPSPLLGVPLLRGYLNKHGTDCMSADLNIRFLRWLITNSQVLNDFIHKSAINFKTLQKKDFLAQKDIILFWDYISALAVAPQDILQKHLESEMILGRSDDRHSDLWIDHLPSLIKALAMVGLFVEDANVKTDPQLIKSSFLRRYEIINSFLNSQEIEPILKQAATSDVVGISVPFFGQQVLAGSLIAKCIRKFNSDVFIIFGGSGLTKNVDIFRQTFFSNAREFDAIGLYEGESTLHKLAECIVAGSNLNDVPNLLFFDSKKNEFITTQYQFPPSVNDLPAPVYNIDELKIYSELGGDWCQGIRVPLMVSRGCWWDKCAFCSDKQFRHTQTPAYQQRSPEKVLNDIEQIQNTCGASYFYLITSAVIPSWARRFSIEVVKRGITAKFWTYMRATSEKIANKEYFELLKNAGFDIITVGVEATVDHILATISKGNTRNEIINTIRGISNAGIRVKFNLIADIPPTTVEDARSNWNFLIANLPYIHDLTVFDYMLVEDTPMAQNPQNYNITIVKDKNGKPKILSPGLIQYVNPLHANVEAQGIIEQTKGLSVDIQFLQLTERIRNKVTQDNHVWNKCSLIFRSFTAIKSRFAPMEGNPRDVYIVILNDMFKYLIVPASFFDFLDMMAQGVKVSISYAKLFEKFVLGLNVPHSDINFIQTALLFDQILDRMVHEGFIFDIDNYQQSVNQKIKEIGIDPQKNLPLAFRKYPFSCSLFLFGAFPFAIVVNTKMA